ncbi:uncharacterized protein LOC124265356 [Haliotis rubra]|uniref:uncharacterized protein LOC124265356 n=1 Tax=Haliotis rubra TaxID=36100 RepID=UPI001EE501CB|nr:uncharacterized protein LOC124265356 [Haliotis rubra]
MTAEGTGIAYFEPTNEVYVALTFDNSSFNGVYAFNRTSFPQIRFLFPYDGITGRLFVSESTLYMNDGQSLLRIMAGETSWTNVVVWSLELIAFVVQDDGMVVFCEESGSVWTYSPTDRLFRQLKEPTANGDHCGDIALRVCDGLVYVALRNVQ